PSRVSSEIVPILRRYIRTGSTLRPRSSIRRGLAWGLDRLVVARGLMELGLLFMNTLRGESNRLAAAGDGGGAEPGSERARRYRRPARRENVCRYIRKPALVH